MFEKLFINHPKSVNETYWQHFRMASTFSAKLFSAAIVCLVHAIVPGLFVKTGSLMITRLHERMALNRVNTKSKDKASDSHYIEYMI